MNDCKSTFAPPCIQRKRFKVEKIKKLQHRLTWETREPSHTPSATAAISVGLGRKIALIFNKLHPHLRAV